MTDLETSLTWCTYCPKLCRHTCPVSNAETRETFVPQQKMATMRLLRIGGVDPDPVAAAPLYACSGCGACTEACKHRITPGRHLFTGRADAERAGAGHPALTGLPDRVRAHAERAATATPTEHRRRDAELALFPSCEEPAAASTTLALLDRLGASASLVDVSLGCGGYPLLAGGFPEAFRLHAEALARQLSGHTRVAVACPACAWAMKVEYPAHGVPLRPKVLHTSELLAGFADRVTVVAPQPAAFYHDPCYLGRWQGIYDAPRNLLSRVLVRLHEFSRARAESACSGGGGVLPLTMPETADAIATERLLEPLEANVPRVVTACATCKKRLSRDGVEARDLVDVLASATGVI